MKAKEEKKVAKAKKTKNTKNTKSKKKKQSFFKAVKTELSKVVWPKKNEVLKYTIATIVFVVILIVFFLLLNLGLSVIKGIFA
ncbi:MAG: preprotein translocase subunit SecE [Bacilli bacterium]|nr:preprotein translocase subunit SecE [Bacilli bacterium]